jgi:diamine N-acetyltransferase
VRVAAIRPARSTDVPALSALAKQTWSYAFGQSIDPREEAIELEEKRSEAYFRRAFGEETILVAEQNGALVGYVQFGDVGIPEVDVEPGDQELQRLYVETEIHGKGVGRELMDAALRHSRLANASRIYLQVWERNEPAIRLYESLGFRAAGTTTFTLGSTQVVEDLVMLLDRAEAER